MLHSLEKAFLFKIHNPTSKFDKINIIILPCWCELENKCTYQ